MTLSCWNEWGKIRLKLFIIVSLRLHIDDCIPGVKIAEQYTVTVYNARLTRGKGRSGHGADTKLLIEKNTFKS